MTRGELTTAPNAHPLRERVHSHTHARAQSRHMCRGAEFAHAPAEQPWKGGCSRDALGAG
eukprot:CAMPEP_0175453868 /NCGR_PEP_ID=MMETSP0095-20121207/64187_1 /TAXON_ID=311494 /ORGANISM="Alexandrium monilatum, Strain CCMP3105" /LENGTH=59 /DNA_ID=CAMNT_0016754545 /DNA_START=126 /DNA_END=302 /DNA_ORIENTATION=+